MIRNVVFFLLSFSLFLTTAHAGDGYKATHPAPAARITPCARGVVYVKMKAGSEVLQSSLESGANTLSIAPSSKFGRAIATLGLREIDPFDPSPKDSISRAFGIDRMYCIYYSNYKIDPHTALRMLIATGEVECGSVRYLFPVSFTPNDPLIGQEYALTNMNIFNAWNTTTGDTNILIADVDIAINIDHEDLKNEVQYNWGETGLDAQGHDKRSNGIDDEKDGYIDNWEGWDLCGDVNVGEGAILKPNNNPRPREATANHGTLTAGCILATGNNGVGVAGIAYGCRLLPVKAAGSDDENIGAGYEGIHYACNHNARVINCSWGGFIPSSDTEYSNIFLFEATARNALVVAAAGNNTATNDGTYEYPADGPGVLSVGATDQTNAPADFSDFGHSVSVWAPGVNVMSTDYQGSVPDSNSVYGDESGTSFSSPLTAGVAGLLMSVHPSWPPQFIARQIIQTAANVVNTADRADYWGLVNADSAMSTAPWPGLIITQYAINGVVSDSLGAAGVQQDLKVTFQDVIAPGTNIFATLIPNVVYSATSTPVMLGTMDSGATASGDFQITRSGVFSQGVVPLKFFVTDGNRLADTLLVYVNLSQIPGFVPDIPAAFGTSIKRVTNTVAWAAFGEEDPTTGDIVSAQFAEEDGGLWSDTSTLNDGTEPPYDVEALDSNNAYFGTGSNPDASVIFTNDGGADYSSYDVSAFTPFVNTIHFFDPLNGILIGDPITNSFKWGIGITTDGGQSWNPLAKPVELANFMTSWNNATAWVGNYGWFGTDSRQIWRTTNRGQNWVSVKTDTNQHSLSIAFDDDATHGFACFRPAAVSGSSTTTGSNGIMVSSDSGASWQQLTTLPVPGIVPASIQFIPNSNTAILTSDMGVYRTSDFGATWVPIGIPVSFSADGAELSISRGDGEFIVSVNSATSSGIATYSEAMPDDGVSVSAPLALSLDVYPNPVQSSSIVAFTLPTSDHVQILLYDALGREVATVLDGAFGAGSHQAPLAAKGLAPGAYYLELENGTGARQMRLVTIVQ